ncbi:MAG: rane protein [Candidatus Saccharibacteria bacterium]|nr:rane protein [Candidatus Saccharibacteria bacterium]
MGLIAFIIIGALVGWIASSIMGRDNGLIMNLLIGVVGSFLGSFVSRLVLGYDDSYLAFDWSAFIWSLIGAVILLGIVGAISGRKPRTAA